MHNICVFSFPRSGSTLVRFLCRKLTGIEEDKAFFSKATSSDRIWHTHKHQKIEDENFKIVLTLRNYKECCVSHVRRFEGKISLFAEAKKMLIRPDIVSSYTEVIQAFDEYEYDKLLIYYEDLMENAQAEVERLAKFLNVPMINNVDELIIEARNSYPEKISDGEKHFHSNKLTQDQKEELDKLAEQALGGLYNKYLDGYKEFLNG